MPITAIQDIPIGDLQLYDNYIPQLAAGKWFIQVSQTLTRNGTTINADPLEAQQEFVVSAPQFTLDPKMVLNQYPPAGSTGRYGEVLPHVVLNDPMIPWERKIADAKVQPWLALMVFEESELQGGEANATRSIPTTVGDFLKLDGTVLAPKPTREEDIDPSTPCSYIRMPVTVFSAGAPLLSELRFLSHCRQVNTGDKAMMGLNEHGLFSVIISNRFPAAPPKGSIQPVKNIAHLVSVEGMEDYLRPQASIAQFETVALVSLASWVFYTQPDQSEDFRALALNLVNSAYDPQAGKYNPDQIWLRLHRKAAGTDANTVEVNLRLAEGYVPLAYQTRSGEAGFAWYRGPLTPVLPVVLAKPSPFFTADAAMIYHKTFGLFDLSLAAAWQVGRQAALSDRLFGQRLMEFRQKAHRFTDALYQQLVSDHFSAGEIDELDHTTTIQDQFLAILSGQLLQDIGADSNLAQQAAPAPLPSTPSDPVADAKAFMADPRVQQQIQAMVRDDLAPVTEWLGRLLLLYPIPFDYLVPDEGMLPPESLRFFYLDMNWLDALSDGAISIGLDSSRQTFFSEVTKSLIHNGALEALATYRNKIRGIKSTNPPNPPATVCGLLLRSALVSGWPNLAVRPYDASDKLLPILRMDHLSPTVLLAMFDGIPVRVEFSEPQEGFGFGVDQDGNMILRNTVPPDGSRTVPVGRQVGKPFAVRDMTGVQPLYMRSATSRVLNLDSVNGLVKALHDALSQAGSAPAAELGPAGLALQMVKSPEAIVFQSQQT